MEQNPVTRKQLLGGGALAGALVLGAAPAAQAHGGDDDIVGSWTGTVTATDPPLGTFGDLISFHEVFTARGTIAGERIEV